MKEIRLYIGEKALKDTSDKSVKTDINTKIASKIAQELGIRGAAGRGGHRSH